VTDIYQRQELLEIYKNPSNKGKLDNPTVTAKKDNSACGDEVALYLNIEDGVITDAKFDGAACAVSIISSSLLTEEVVGKTVEEAKKLSKDDLLGLIGGNLTTSRVKCATLVLEALDEALEEID
jgi:SUF system NifU family Fe-S assembly protein